MCGIWHAVWTTSISRRRSHCARTPRPSIGAMHWRAVRNVRVTDTAALASNALRSASTSDSRKTLSPQCSCRSGASASRAKRVSAIAGSSSRSSSTAAARFLGLGPRRRHARGHQLPDVTDALAREHRLLRDLEAGQPRARDDGLHTAQILGEEHSVSEAVGLPRPAHPVRGRAGFARRRSPGSPRAGCRRRIRRARAGTGDPPCEATARRPHGHCPCARSRMIEPLEG